jgi:hypothetical protein
VDPALELRQGEGLLSYYSLQDEQIYLTVPDPCQPRGKFDLLLFRFATNLDSTDEIMRLLELLIPWLVAHETGHHLRRKYGLFGPDVWMEEWIASKLATLFVRPRLSASEETWLLDHLARIMAGFAPLLDRGRNRSEEAETRCRRPESAPPVATARAIDGPIGYLLTHMGWLYRDLRAQSEETLGEFVQAHLRTNADSSRRRDTVPDNRRRSVNVGQV